MLRESHADVKHIIVSTDGIGGPGDFDGLAKKMAAAGITMSTVGVGSEPVRPFMQKLADEAKGRAYFCENGQAIPQIFQSDTVVTAKIGITEEPFFPQVVHSTAILHELNMAHARRHCWATSRRRPGRRPTSCWRQRRASRSWPRGIMVGGPRPRSPPISKVAGPRRG